MNQERSEREEWGDEGWEFDQLSADLSTALARIDELKGDLRELRENVLLGLGMTAEDVAEMDDDSMEPSIAFLLSGHQEVVAQLAALKAAGEWRLVSERPDSSACLYEVTVRASWDGDVFMTHGNLYMPHDGPDILRWRPAPPQE